MPAGPSFLERLGLHRPELRAWALYDWANSVFMTTVLQVFPLFFVAVPAKALPEHVARARFSFATSIAVVMVGLVGPILGAVADYRGSKKLFLAIFLGVGVVSTGAMYLIPEGGWQLALALFVVGNVGATSTLAFYNALLPSIASTDEMDRVSTAGFALGYVGGGILLAANLAMMGNPTRFGFADASQATRFSFLTAAVWWLLFSIPLLRTVPEPARKLESDEGSGQNALLSAIARLGETLRELRGHKDAALLLLAFLIYNDAINTIIRQATSFGDELRIPKPHLVGAILLVQFVGIPFAFAFGNLASRIGAKHAIFVGLAAYAGITIYGYNLHTTTQFYVLAVLVATVMGGTQALSRSLFASMIPKHKAGEMFGFFGVFDRFGGAMGSALFGLVLQQTGSSRPAILALIVFFIVGSALLSRVDVDRGRRLAREAEAALHGAR